MGILRKRYAIIKKKKYYLYFCICTGKSKFSINVWSDSLFHIEPYIPGERGFHAWFQWLSGKGSIYESLRWGLWQVDSPNPLSFQLFLWLFILPRISIQDQIFMYTENLRTMILPEILIYMYGESPRFVLAVPGWIVASKTVLPTCSASFTIGKNAATTHLVSILFPISLLLEYPFSVR